MARVLIVEDDRDLADAEKELLVAAGAICVVVHSLDEARDAESDVLRCQTAIIDVNLGPEQPTGIEVLAWLRSRGFTGTAVFLTGHARTHPLVREAAKTGGATVLAKPVSAHDLMALAA